MRVLIVNDYGVLAGGAERITVDLRDGLRARGHDARLFASTASDFPLPNAADVSCFGTNGWARRLLQVNNPAAVVGLSRTLATFRPTIVHVRMFLTQLSTRILPLVAGTPALLHVGNYQTICPLNTRILPDQRPCPHRAGMACYRAGCVSVPGLARTLVQLGAWRRQRHVFDLIVANSHALARTLGDNDVTVGQVIWNGTRVVPARPPLADPPTVVFAGRLMPRKGVDVLLRSMARVVSRIPAARLIIAGEGPDRARIERLVGHFGLGAHVTLCGHLAQAELSERLSCGWVQAAPSRYLEPFSNVVAEAMMRGTAVVASNAGGTPEFLRDGTDGFLVEPGDAEALAARIEQILVDRQLAELMGAAGRGRALAELTTELMVDRFEAAYAALLHGRQRRYDKSE